MREERIQYSAGGRERERVREWRTRNLDTVWVTSQKIVGPTSEFNGDGMVPKMIGILIPQYDAILRVVVLAHVSSNFIPILPLSFARISIRDLLGYIYCALDYSNLCWRMIFSLFFF